MSTSAGGTTSAGRSAAIRRARSTPGESTSGISGVLQSRRCDRTGLFAGLFCKVPLQPPSYRITLAAGRRMVAPLRRGRRGRQGVGVVGRHLEVPEGEVGD